MEKRYMPFLKVLIIDNSENPYLNAESMDDVIKINESTRLPLHSNPYVAPSTKILMDVIKDRMCNDSDGFYHLAWGFPYVTPGVGGLSSGLFIDVYTNNDDLLVLPSDVNQDRWGVTIPTGLSDEEYTALADELFALIKRKLVGDK